MIPCTCINDQNKPKEIPQNKWVKKGEKYTISHIYWHPVQKVQGVELFETQLDENCAPYKAFKIQRFSIPLTELENLITLCEACTFMNSVDIEELLKELTLETA